MSTVIDQRVAELRFDNANFEKNVATTMGTLDRLKQALHLTGASKGLEQVGAAANGIKLNPLTNAVEQVGLKFNMAYSIANRFFENITDGAFRAGKQLVKSLTVDQITSGWGKYGRKTESVQTIMNATGKSIDEVNQYLEKLMWFSDETSYGFTDMTAALGQMTSSGGDIDKLIPLITGVANATAYAGKGASEFSRVMYNLNQSYGAGYLQMMDWKSVELAGVGSKQLKQIFIDTAEELGKIEKGQVTISNFATTLKDKWADTEVMEAAFGKFGEFSDAVNKLVNGDISEFSKEIQDLYNAGEIETASDAIEALSGKYGEVGEKAFKSAQEAKTFTEAIDATKDAVSSGWMKTFEIIFGNYQEAKETWTDLANFLWDVFASGGERRNAILEKVFGKDFLKPLEKVKDTIEKVKEPIDKVTKSLVDYKKVVDEIIGGKWGNGQARWDALAKAGYDWAHAQNLVNERLGSSVRHATNYSEATDKVTESTKQAAKANGKLIEELVKMEDSELLDAGYTKDQVKNLREVEKLARKLGISVSELVDNADQINGRWILLDSIKNVGNTIVTIFKAIKAAWDDAFGFTDDQAANFLFDLIAAFHRFSEAIQVSDGVAAKITSTFKGLFAILDILLSIALTPIKIAFSLLGKSMKGITTGAGGILDFTAAIGENIAKFRDWLEEHNVIREGFERLIEIIGNFITKINEVTNISGIFDNIKNSISDFKKSMTISFDGPLKAIDEGIKKATNGTKTLGGALADIVTGKADIHSLGTLIKQVGDALAGTAEGDRFQKAVAKIKSVYDSLISTLSTAKDKIVEIGGKIKEVLGALFTGDWARFEEYGNNIVDGLGSGLVNGFNKIKNIVVNLATTVYKKFCEVLGINSPSKIFKWIGQMCLDGLIKGLKATSAGKIVVGMIELGKLMLNPLRAFLGIHSPAWKFIELAMQCVEGIFVGIKKMLPKVAAFFKEFGKNLLNYAKNIEWDKIFMVGLSVGAFIGINKTLENINNTCKTVLSPLTDVTGAFKTLSSSISGFTTELKNLAKTKRTETYSKILMNLAISIVLLVAAILILSKIPVGQLWASIGALAVLAGIIYVLALACEKMTKIGKDGEIVHTAVTLVALGGALLTMAIALKVLSTIDIEKIPGVIAMFITIVTSLGVLIAIIGNFVNGGVEQHISKVGTMLIKLSVAFLLMIAVVKIAATMDANTIVRGVGALAAIELLFLGIIAVCKCVGQADASKAGSLLLKMSLALIIMVGVVKLASKLSPKEVFKGLAFVAAVEILFAAIIAVSYFAGENAAKAGTMLFMMAGAMAIMIAVVKLAATLKPTEMTKGAAVMAVFSAFINGFMLVSQYAGKDLDKVGQMLISISISMLIMVGIIILIKNMDPKGLGTALGVMYVLASICTTLVYVCSLIKEPGKVMGMLIVITVLISVLSGTLITLSLLNKKKVANAAAALSAVIATLALLVKATSYLTLNEKTWYRSLIVLGVLTLVIAGLAGIMLVLGRIKNGEKARAAAEGISVMLVALAGSLNIISRSKTFTDNKLSQIIKAFVILSGLLIILAVVLRIMDGINGAHAIGNAVAVSVLLGALSLVVERLSLMDGRRTSKLPKIIYNMALLSGVMIVLALVVASMKDVPADRGLASALILSELIAVLTGVVIALSKFGSSKGNLEQSVIAIAALGLVLFELADVIIHMNDIDAQKAIPNATALSELITVLGGVTIALTRFTKQSTGLYSAVGAMAILGAVIAELATSLIAMSKFDTQNAITNATALTILIAAMGGVTYAFSWMGKYIAGLYAGMGAMAILGAVLFELAGVLIIMSKYDTKNAIANATALSILLTFMAPVAALFGAIGLAAGPMFAGIAAMGVMAIVVGMLGEVLVKMQELDPRQAIGTVVALGVLMTVMIPVMAALLGIGTIIIATEGIGAAAIAAGFAVMVALVAGIAGVIIAAGAIIDKFPTLETFLDKGLDLIKKLAQGIGEIIGLFLGGILSGGLSFLPNFADSLSEFMINLKGFIDGVKPLGSDDSFKKGAKALITTLLMFVAVEFLNGITKLSTLGLGSLVTFGAELTMFWYSAKGFIEGAKQLDPSLMKGIKTLSEAILLLTAASFIDGITRFITGGVNFASFALGMIQLGAGVNGFITQVGTLDDTHVGTATKAAEIIKTLASAAATIPNSGGWLAKLIGDNDLATWAKGLKSIAVGVADFCNTLTENKITSESVTLAGNAASIITKLATAAGKIPNSGGWLATLIGDNELSLWSSSLGTVGQGIADFCKPFTTTPVTKDHVTMAKHAADIISKLATASANIPNSGGWIAKLIGDNDLAAWSEALPSLAVGITKFVGNLGELDDTSVEKANSAAKLISAIANMCKQNAGESFVSITEKFAGFNTAVTDLGSGVKAFVDKLKGVSSEQIDNAIANLKSVMNAFSSVADVDTESMKNLGESLKSVATDSINGLVKAFKGEDQKTKIKTTGAEMMQAFADGLKSKKDEPKKEAKSAAEKAYKAAGSKTMKSNFRTAGTDCVQGFVNGLKDKEYIAKVTAAGTALGKAALKAAKEALDENSPSKEMYKVGAFAGIGFTNALVDHESKAYDAGESVATYAKNGLTKAIAKVNSWFNGEITTQPTIRPVVDLSNVRSGAAAIDGMFGSRSVGLTANLNSINSRMSEIQNGGNDDVVRAIDKLRKDLGKVGGTNNYIGNVSAGNDESVTDAINVLIGAARRDRRS